MIHNRANRKLSNKPLARLSDFDANSVFSYKDTIHEIKILGSDGHHS